MTYFIEAANIVKNYKFQETAFLPHYVTIPLNLEGDKSYVPCVKVGDTVTEGQVIASSVDGINIHSSIPGEVIEIAPCFCPNGKQYFGIKIKLGGKFSYVGKRIEAHTSENLLTSTILDRLVSNCVFNTFDVAYPTNLGLQIKENKTAKNLVVRLFDEDNYRYTDSLISKFFFNDVLEGAKTIAKSFNAENIVFAYNLKDENGANFQKCTTETIKFVPMNIKRYPSGSKREIVSAFSKNSVIKKTTDFKLTRNDIFIDSSTAYQAFKAVNKNIPSISKTIFIYGNCLKTSGLLEVKIGTTLETIVNQIGGFSKEPKQIIINGLITGTSIASMETPITEYVKSISFISKDTHTDKHIFNCINCGNCRFICPVKLSPDVIYNNLVHFKKLPENISKTSLACTNCGLCNINCPARLPLCQSIMYLKNKIIEEEGINYEK